MKLKELFYYERARPVHANKVEIFDSYRKKTFRYITRTVKGNGIKGYISRVDDTPPNKGGCITVPMNGEGLLTPFVQTKEFYTANLVAILRPKKFMSEEEMCWISTLIKHNRNRFSSHGREVNEKRLMNLEVPEIKMPKIKNKYKKDLLKLNEVEKDFFEEALSKTKIFDFFDIFTKFKNGSAKINTLQKGDIALVSATEKPGGITKRVSAETNLESLFTISNNGSIGFLNFIDQPFVATPDITTLKIQGIEKPNFLLIIWLKTFVELNRVKFNYGRKLKTRLKEIRLPMPIKENGDINWELLNKTI